MRKKSALFLQKRIVPQIAFVFWPKNLHMKTVLNWMMVSGEDYKVWLKLELNSFVRRTAKMWDNLMWKSFCLDHVRNEENAFIFRNSFRWNMEKRTRFFYEKPLRKWKKFDFDFRAAGLSYDDVNTKEKNIFFSEENHVEAVWNWISKHKVEKVYTFHLLDVRFSNRIKIKFLKTTMHVTFLLE